MTSDTREVATITDLCSGEELPEVEIISLVQEQIPRYRLRADTLTTFGGYENEDWFIPSPALKIDDADFEITSEQAQETLNYFLLCSNRVSQMTKAYNDIEAVTRLLEEKERDLELAARIGKSLLDRKNSLEERVASLEAELTAANDTVTQLRHDLCMKNDLLQLYTNDVDDSGSEAGTPVGLRGLNLDLLQRKIATLEEENVQLHSEASQLARDTSTCEEREQQLLTDVLKQLADANSQAKSLNEDLTKKSDDHMRQQEEITHLLAQVVDLQVKVKKLNTENEELSNLLQVTKECQNDLACELCDFKDKYAEVVDHLRDSKEELRRLTKKGMPFIRGSTLGASFAASHYNPDSLASELESSLHLGGPSPGERGSHVKKVFETVRAATKAMQLGAASATASPAHSSHSPMSTATTTLTSTSQPLMSSGPSLQTQTRDRRPSDMSSSGYQTHSSGYPSLESTNLSDSEWSTTTDAEDFYQLTSAMPGAMATFSPRNDLEAALRRLTPSEVAARRARLARGYEVSSDGMDTPPTLPYGIRTPDSIMSTGSLRSGSSLYGYSGSSGYNGYSGWRLPDKLQIVKPIEGSQTLQQWSQLATPHLGGFLDDRPGVQIRGGRELEDLGLETYGLSDLEEDDEFINPGKVFQNTTSVYTYTNSTVLHPDDHTHVTSSLQGSQMSAAPSRPISTSSTPCPTPASSLSRRNSCSTFSTHLGLATLLHERGIKAVTPSAVATPASERSFSPTATPCNSPDGSPPSTPRIEGDGFGGFFSMYETMTRGADLLMRTFTGEPTSYIRARRASRKLRKMGLSGVDRKSLANINLMEKLHRIGVDNIMSTTAALTPLTFQGPLYTRRNIKSPMAQLTSLKTLGSSSGSESDSGTSSISRTPSREGSELKTSPLGVPARPNTGALKESRLGPRTRPDLGTVGGRRRSRVGLEKEKEGGGGRESVVGTLGALFFGRKGGLM